jgi:hypothetical protein
LTDVPIDRKEGETPQVLGLCKGDGLSGRPYKKISITYVKLASGRCLHDKAYGPSSPALSYKAAAGA